MMSLRRSGGETGDKLVSDIRRRPTAVSESSERLIPELLAMRRNPGSGYWGNFRRAVSESSNR
jgi:hypothetical protein